MDEHPCCQETLASISDYIDGSLAETFCRELEAHLAGCPSCRVVVDTMRKTILLYQSTTDGTDQLPPLVRERLYRKLDLEEYLKH